MKRKIGKIVLIAYIIGIIFPMNVGAIVSDNADIDDHHVVTEQNSVHEEEAVADSDSSHCNDDTKCKGCEGVGHCLCAAGCSVFSLITFHGNPHSLLFNNVVIDSSVLKENTKQSFLQEIFRPPRT